MSNNLKGAAIWRPFLLLASQCLALFGLAVSAWAHLLSLLGIDPGGHVRPFWLFQLLLIILALPICAELIVKKGAPIFRCSGWVKWVLYLLLFYYGINFYFFLYWSSNHLSSAATWRMFSAGWLLLFSVAAVFYRVRYTETVHRLST